MTLSRVVFAFILGISLTGCFQTSLVGPTGATRLSVAPLRAPDAVLLESVSRDQQAWIALLGQGDWDNIDPSAQLLFIGTNGFSKAERDLLDPARLYLITADGGMDYAPQGGDTISDNPEIIQGKWHAIATGQRIIDGNLKVSALTEASYRQVQARLEQLNDDQVQDQLDATARLLLSDIDDSGDVDHNDVLRWSRAGDAASYFGDISDIDALATSVRTNQPAAMLDTMAKGVLGSRRVVLQTNFGTITLDTLNWEAPVTADNFLRYVEADFYAGIVFHRTIRDFMIQTGIWELVPGSNQVVAKQARGPIRNESRNSISNQRGTLAMARTGNPDSASSQFFINQVDNSFLDYGSSGNPDGYTVFAQVVSGMDIVDEIANLPAGPVSGISEAVPSEIVLIEAVTIQN